MSPLQAGVNHRLPRCAATAVIKLTYCQGSWLKLSEINCRIHKLQFHRVFTIFSCLLLPLKKMLRKFKFQLRISNLKCWKPQLKITERKKNYQRYQIFEIESFPRFKCLCVKNWGNKAIVKIKVIRTPAHLQKRNWKTLYMIHCKL